MRLLIDTCIIVDYLEDREGADAAEKLLSSPTHYRIVTAKTILDLYYLIHQYTHDRTKTLEAVESIADMADEIVDTTRTDVINALKSTIRDYEDAVMVQTAIRIKADYIITRNIKDYKHSDSMPAITPEEFFNEIEG